MIIQDRQLAPAKKRQSTDFICLLLYVIVTLLLLTGGLYCFITGSANNLTLPYDSDGKGCGLNYPNHPYIYFPSPQYDSLWVTTCVSQCPTSTTTTINCQPNSIVKSCTPNNSVNNTKAFHIYPTYLYRGNICMANNPTVAATIQAGIASPLVQSFFGSAIYDWTIFLLMLPVILLLSLLTILLIRLTAGYVIYVFYAIAIAAFVGFGVFMAIPSTAQNPFVLKQNPIIAYVIAFVSLTVSILILLIFCNYKERIKVAVSYINQANDFFKNNCSLVSLPFVLVAVTVFFVYFWMLLTFSFYSQQVPTSQAHPLPFQHFNLSLLANVGLIMAIAHLIWSLFLLIHSGTFIVSSTIVNWSFQRQKCFNYSYRTFFASHLGSVCAGSFLTALLGPFKFELDQADCSQREENIEDNRCVDCLKRCYGCCCCFCITFVFKCFHRSAYTYQNLTGLTYCQSSYEVNDLIRFQKDKWCEKWTTIASLCMVLQTFIPFAIIIITIIIANLCVNSIYQATTTNRLLVFWVLALMSYAIAKFFIGIYAETIQSIFVIRLYYTSLLPNKEQHPLQQSYYQDSCTQAGVALYRSGNSRAEPYDYQRRSLFPEPAK